MEFREILAADAPALFELRPRTRENVMTVEELARLGITVESVIASLSVSSKGWLCADAGKVVGFSIADRATGELEVVAVLPEYEGRGVGNGLMARAEAWLWSSGCTRAWLTTDLDTSLRAYGFYRKRGWTDWKTNQHLRWMELLPPGAAGERGTP
jgi:GNAT superfamily N-acetyltransferase